MITVNVSSTTATTQTAATRADNNTSTASTSTMKASTITTPAATNSTGTTSIGTTNTGTTSTTTTTKLSTTTLKPSSTKIVPYTVLGNYTIVIAMQRTTPKLTTATITSTPSTISTTTATSTVPPTTSTMFATTKRRKPKTTPELSVEEERYDDFYLRKEFETVTGAVETVLSTSAVTSYVPPLTHDWQDVQGASAVPLTVWIEIADPAKDGGEHTAVAESAPGRKPAPQAPSAQGPSAQGPSLHSPKRVPLRLQSPVEQRAAEGNPFAAGAHAAADPESEEVDIIEEETFVQDDGGAEEEEPDHADHRSKWYDSYSVLQESPGDSGGEAGAGGRGKWYERD